MRKIFCLLTYPFVIMLTSVSCNKSNEKTSVLYEIKGEMPTYIFGILRSEPKTFENFLDIPLKKLRTTDEVYFETNPKSEELKTILEPLMVDWETYQTYPDSLKQIFQPPLYFPKIYT